MYPVSIPASRSGVAAVISSGVTCRLAQRRDKESIIIQTIYYRGRSIHNVLALLYLNIVRKLATRNALLCSLFSTVWAEERLPVVGHAEDDIGPLESGFERLNVIQVDSYNFSTSRRQLLGRGRGGVAGQTTDLEAGAEESTGYGAALVPGSANNTNELVDGHFPMIE
ncbi:hypothetical protein HG530_015060 [Fusarium avenaceum]|nr:hypothetical protein HG530_015060 [Fusarium avenaceum]